MDSSVADVSIAPPQAGDRRITAASAMAALGIVYGDLGTSPLYTYQTIIEAAGGHVNPRDAVGLLSLVVWALLITVSLKYCVFVMRADNNGEGGILALMSLVAGKAGRSAAVLIAMALFGAALIYGDGMITPAISVLSALEGIDVATNAFKPYTVPAALVILVALFAAQTKGTARIASVFGPVMLVWFLVIGVLGASGIIRRPEVLMALSPLRAVEFLVTHGWIGFAVLGGVFLAITGGEALYADMGHIGRAPIRASWFCLVLPALLLSYAGQTALLIENPAASDNPFFKLAPDWAIIPLVILATLATIIASQAIITGAFSLTRQAMQLGWFPGLNIRQTSADEYGQIYVPVVNWIMMVGTLTLTYGFGSSDKLAAAFGAAVSTTMLLTTALLYDAMRHVWRWPPPLALLVSLLFLIVDLAFFSANMLKIWKGGWIPLALGLVMFIIMTTWHRGLAALRAKLSQDQQTPEDFIASLKTRNIARVPGTAVFLSRSGAVIPPLMTCHVAQMKALQETVISLTVQFEEIPRIASANRAEVEQLAPGLWHVTVHFGFVEIPDLPEALKCAKEVGCPLSVDDVVYFAASDEVVRSPLRPRMPTWRRMMFGVMYRNAVRVPDRFDVPAAKFVAVGRQVEL